MFKKIENIKEKVSIFGITAGVTLMSMTDKVLATGGTSAINTTELTTVTSKIKDAVTTLAMPIGSLLIFICVVLTAIKLAINHNNPKGRSETLASIGWLVIAGLLLGASLIVAGVIVKVTSNNGTLYAA